MIDRLTRMLASLFPHMVGGMLLCATSGCVMRGNVEALEAQLRAHESLLAQYQRDTQILREDLRVAHREADLLRSELAENKGQRLFQETTQSLAAVEGMQFHTLLTAGQDLDDTPGDERLHATLYPHDRHGEVVKLGGTLELEAIDPSQPAERRTVGKWQFSPEKTRELWHSGFLASGFQVNLPWDRNPVGSNILLHAKLNTPDGRQFETTHTLNIDPPVPSKLDLVAEELISPPKAEKSLPRLEPPTGTVELQPTPEGQPLWEERRVPRPAPLETQVEAHSVETAQPLFESTAPDEVSVQPRPFPGTIETSDNWTEATIPQWR